jgi:hypothetical protein
MGGQERDGSEPSGGPSEDYAKRDCIYATLCKFMQSYAFLCKKVMQKVVALQLWVKV